MKAQNQKIIKGNFTGLNYRITKNEQDCVIEREYHFGGAGWMWAFYASAQDESSARNYIDKNENFLETQGE